MLHLHGLDLFKKRFFNFEGRSLDHVSEWISHHHSGVQHIANKSSNKGPVARFARAAVDDFSLVSYKWNADIEGQFLEDHPAIFLSVPLSGLIKMEADDIGRVEPRPDQLRLYRRAAGHRNIKSSNFENLSLIVPNQLLEERAKSTYQDEHNAPLKFDPLLNMHSLAGQTFVSLISYLATQLAQRPETFESDLIRSSMREWLVSTLFASWPHNYHRCAIDQDPSRIPIWVRRAEDYMRAHCLEPITIADIANDAGCSERTLQVAFKAHNNTSPMQALRNIRLEQAHEDVGQGEETITDIALKWGFGHPSRFAKLYAEHYGHTPSKSRRLISP